jgi:hypothetical protein
MRRLGPLLFTTLRRHAVPPGPGVTTALRTAYMREELRSKTYHRACRGVFAELDAADVPYVVFRGAALGEVVYADPALRHSHDVNLLLQASDVGHAVDALLGKGYTRLAEADDAITLRHESGLPVLLHSQFFHHPFFQLSWEDLWSRRAGGSVAGHPVQLLSAADALLHSCCQPLLRPRPSPLIWACDASLLVQRSPELDWECFLAEVERARAVLPVAAAVRYLTDALQCPVPRFVTDRLDVAAASVDALERDVALLVLRKRPAWATPSTDRAPASWPARLAALRWQLFPSAEYLRWAYGVRHPLLLPATYARRGIHFLQRRAAGAWRGFARSRIGREAASAAKPR